MGARGGRGRVERALGARTRVGAGREQSVEQMRAGAKQTRFEQGAAPIRVMTLPDGVRGRTEPGDRARVLPMEEVDDREHGLLV